MIRTATAAAALLLAALPLTSHAATAPAAPAAPAGPPPAAADFAPISPENLLVIDTSKGRVVVEMTPALGAEAVERIKVLARRGFYDGLKFFRVIDDFMVQGGDPQNTGQGSSDLPNIKGVFSFRTGPGDPFTPVGKLANGADFGFIGPVPATSQPGDLALMTADGKVNGWGMFCAGVAGMARAQDPDSANSQFYLMRQTNNNLDRKYAPWGRVVEGLDVVRSIAVGEPPAAPDAMTKVRVASDLPAAEQPKLSRVRADSAYAKAMAARALAASGAEFTPCSLELPVRVG